MPELGGPGGPLAPQYLADQLTLFQPGRADYPHLLLLAPPMFFTFRHHWFHINPLIDKSIFDEQRPKFLSLRQYYMGDLLIFLNNS